MAEKKKKNPHTPIAPCKWAFLGKPSTKFDENGKYQVKLIFDPNDPFIVNLNKAFERELAEAKKLMKPAEAAKIVANSPISTDTDADGNDTGFVNVAFTSPAYYKDKQTGAITPKTLKAYDAQGKAMTNIPSMGNGSRLEIEFSPKGNIIAGKQFYLTLYINAYQLVELVAYEQDGTSRGFGKVDNGFVADESVSAGSNDFGGSPDAGGGEEEIPF